MIVNSDLGTRRRRALVMRKETRLSCVLINTTYVVGFFLVSFLCFVQVNSSDPTKVNCSVTEDYVCGDARSRAANNSEYSVTSCISYCCTTPKCNVKHLVPGTPTTAQTPVGTTVESGVPGHWPQLSFVLIGLATCAYMLK